MALVAPSVLSADFSKLGEAIAFLDKAAVDFIHIDVMDGKYVPNLTFGPPVIKAMRSFTSIPFDVHLMIDKPEDSVDDYIAAGADRITFHIDATIHAHRLIHKIKEAGVKAGVSLNPSQNPESIRYLLDDVDLVLLMSVNPGFGGQSFIEHSLEKVKKLKALIQATHSHTLIEIDGGVNFETGRELVAAGANALVAGSFVFKSEDPEATIAGLKNLKTE